MAGIDFSYWEKLALHCVIEEEKQIERKRVASPWT